MNTDQTHGSGMTIAIGGRSGSFHVGDAANQIGGLGEAILLSGRLMTLAQKSGFAEEIYKALCNTVWTHRSGGLPWGCAWRCAGDIAAALRGYPDEDYMTFYRSGGEGRVTDETRTEFGRLGWSEYHEH
jgi:hypothetical protein